MVKSLPAVWEIQVESFGQEDTLEKENGNPLQYSSWKIPWMEEIDISKLERKIKVNHK